MSAALWRSSNLSELDLCTEKSSILFDSPLHSIITLKGMFRGFYPIRQPLYCSPRHCKPVVRTAVLRVTRNETLAEKKRHTGLVTAFAVGIILLVVTWDWDSLLMILGIGLPAFQVAGGVVDFMMAISMLNAEESPMKQTPEEHKERAHGAIVPLAIPIIAGPGTQYNHRQRQSVPRHPQSGFHQQLPLFLWPLQWASSSTLLRTWKVYCKSVFTPSSALGVSSWRPFQSKF